MRALIASGTGRYADPWHPFPRTSALISEILEQSGFQVEIDDDVDHALQRLRGIHLLVVNAGDPWRGDEKCAPAPVSAGKDLSDALRAGMGVLAVHCAVSSLRDYPDWFSAIGATWLPGLSWHPPASSTIVRGGALPGGEAVADFEVFDERYCRLQRIGRSTIVATHDGEADREPTAWVREHGASRVAVDLLGHDERSYESAGHRELLASLAGWAVGGLD